MSDTDIINCLRDEYGLNVIQVTFLPPGADSNAAVYRVVTSQQTSYFLKLKRGSFDDNKERALMFVAGDIGGIWYTNHEEACFYEGYGQAEIDPVALTCHRYERIIEDIAVTCQQIFLSGAGGENRAAGLGFVIDYSQPNGILERTYRSEGEGRP